MKPRPMRQSTRMRVDQNMFSSGFQIFKSAPCAGQKIGDLSPSADSGSSHYLEEVSRKLLTEPRSRCTQISTAALTKHHPRPPPRATLAASLWRALHALLPARRIAVAAPHINIDALSDGPNDSTTTASAPLMCYLLPLTASRVRQHPSARRGAQKIRRLRRRGCSARSAAAVAARG